MKALDEYIPVVLFVLLLKRVFYVSHFKNLFGRKNIAVKAIIDSGIKEGK